MTHQHPFLGRVMAALAGMIVTFILDLLGVAVTAEQKEGIIAWLTTGFTALGIWVWLTVYALAHKLLNKRLNPSDTAVS